MASISSTFVVVVVVLNIAAVMALAIYAFYQGTLLLLYLFYRLRARALAKDRQPLPPCSVARSELPFVTVQIPLYNERYVAERIIATACSLDYPLDRLQIQVLDDSVDDTSRIVQRAVQAQRARGIDIELVHRDRRDGYKAGALANGMQTARGELIAIFDADFVPPGCFLRRIIEEHQVFTNPRVGFVQTRWGYLNADSSAVTRAQVLLLDSHFVIDQFTRYHAGMGISFNGSGGIWRRTCIEDVGGWQTDTLTEDLDLSYSAQLKGWRGTYLSDDLCPGELPNSVLAFKHQQARWARGSAQCVRKLLRPIMKSSLPLSHKLAAWMHLTGYFASVFLVLLAVITPLLMLETSFLRALPSWLSIISLICLLPMLSMFVAQCVQGRPRFFLHNLPTAIMLGIGVSISNCVAVLKGLLGRQSGEFVRTPKSVSHSRYLDKISMAPHEPAGTLRSYYTLQPDWTIRAELALGVYAFGVCIWLALRGEWLSTLPLLVYVYAFFGVSLGQFGDSIGTLLHGRSQPGNIESHVPFIE